MLMLTKEQADVIVKRLMEDIPYNINLMNNQGRIIASGDYKRIGERHRAAERAIKEGKMVEVFKDTSLEKKETNEPIIFQDKVIGVVGISGEPEEVKPFTKLVRTVSLLLVEELNKYKQMEKTRQRKDQFLKDLLAAEGHYPKELSNEAIELYNLNLAVNQSCLFSTNRQRLTSLLPGHEIFQWRQYFIAFSEEMVPPVATSELLISSPLRSDLGQTIREVWDTFLYVSFLQLPKERTYFTKDYYFSNFFEFPMAVDNELVEKLKLIYDEYEETILCFAKNNAKINETADQLHIHRNTLNYRIQRIAESTGKDIRVWYELWELVYHLAYCFKAKMTETVSE